MLLYNYLTVYGTSYETTHKLNNPKKFVQWTEDNFEYVKYNPRKDVNRYGLSITSLDGRVNGVPDLDSLFEYNKENKTAYGEHDFKTYTPVYDYPELAECIDPIKDHIFRSHIIRLDPGGFFPPHRDFRGMNIDSFRLLIPLKNMNPPSLTFIIDNQIQYWNNGSIYFADTAKMHYVFNSSFESSYMIVLNVELSQHTVNFVTNNMKQR
jgi:hypothetical protein